MTRHQPSAFERYYDLFLQNSLRGKRFAITLTTGEEVEGIPTAGSIIDPTDPRSSFTLRADDGNLYRIPFSRLANVAPAGTVVGIVRTVDVDTLAAGDLFVQLTSADAERLLISDDWAEVDVTLEPGSQYYPAHDYYKYLTVHGTDFNILKIDLLSGSDLRLTVERR